VRGGGSQRAYSERRRPTIGYLAPAIHGGSLAQWLGVMDAAEKHDVNLICFPGESPNFPTGFAVQANILYDLASTETMDGLITWASSIGNYMSDEEIQAFHGRYGSLPMVSIGRVLDGIPGLLMDSYEGMCEAILHLVEVHGCRRLAFIRGPEGHFYAQERYRAYLETLGTCGISVNPNLVTPPSMWGTDKGEEGMRLLIEERKQNPGADFEAVVAANDEMIIGAWDVLRARGVRVPGDVAVVGFDDRLEGRARTPPLTSVASPFYETGYQSVETLLALMEGKQVPEERVVPSRLVVRQTCGCLGAVVARVASGQQPAGRAEAGHKDFEIVLSAQREELLAAMVQAVEEFDGSLDLASAGRLVDSLAAELEGQSKGSFLAALNESLGHVIEVDGDDSEGSVTAMQNAISTLRHSLLPCLNDEALVQAEDLWQQARLVIGETVQRVCMQQAIQTDSRTRALRETGSSLMTTFDVGNLVDVLAEGLPALGIPSAYFALYQQRSGLDAEEQPLYTYPDPAPEWSRLVLAYDEAAASRPKRVELGAGGRRFRSRQLVPEGLWSGERRYSFVVLPLYFRHHQIGFSLLEVGPREGMVYDVLRGEISSALRGALLLRERERAEAALEQAYTEVERQVQERTAELEREAKERERAQAENLRLQQEIIEAQRHALQELSTPIIPVLEGIIVVPLIGSIDTMRARDFTRALLAGIRQHRARVVIVDITGVPMVDSGVADHLNKTIQAARLKGARTIITGISDAVAETIVDLGIDWGGIETLSDLQTGLRAVLQIRSG
jgi:DNA-binding LacI/PurR family transcriptional regulator/anti-anti-sigma regulatory factor